MAKIVKEREPVVVVEYAREFLDETQAGYSFDCNENGELDLSKLSECAIENYKKCINGDFPELEDKGVVRYERKYTEPAIIQCDCKTEFPLIDSYYGACSCPNCNQWYNLFGQRLNPPEMWEEDLE